MDLAATVERAHADYQAAYGRFVAEQRSSGTRGTAELKVLLGDGKGLYRKLWCLDFISNDDEPRMVEMSGGFRERHPFALGRAEKALRRPGLRAAGGVLGAR